MKSRCLIHSNEPVLHSSPESPADPECCSCRPAVGSMEVRPVRELNL